MIESVWHDLRYAIRLLRLDLGFTSVAVLSLALGIGANTALFHLLDAVRLRSLPVKNPQELAEVKISDKSRCCAGNFSNRRATLTYPQWKQIEARQQAFSDMFAFAPKRFDLTNGGESRYAEGLMVSGGFFQTLGVSPLLGRVITPQDDRPGCGLSGAVISYSFWQRQFAGDRDILGRKLTLTGHPVEVIGVTPPGFFGVEVGKNFDVAVCTCAEPVIEGENSHMEKRHHWWLAVIGRLKPGWTVSQARAQLEAVSPGIFSATLPPMYPPDMAKNYLDFKLDAAPAGDGLSDLRKNYQSPLILLLSIAGLVLLIACANLANLLLARASAREREIAIRLALGASRNRLIRQLLAESLLLSLTGAALGMLLAQFLTSYMVRFLNTADDPLYVDLSSDWRVLAFTAGLAALTCILFGLMPALRATAASPVDAMKASSRGLTAGRERFGVRRALVVSQVALSLILLVGALLFVRTLQNLTTLDAGFREHGLLIVNVGAGRAHYSPERRYTAYRELLQNIRNTPGVQNAASSAIIPISGDVWNNRIVFPGRPPAGQLVANFNRVSAGYFSTLGTPIVAGRGFDDRDTMDGLKVAIVNEAFVNKFLTSQTPIGVQFRVVTGPGEPPEAYQIVGVSRNAKYRDLREPFVPTAFLPSSQEPKPQDGISLLVRSEAPLGQLLHDLKETIMRVNPALAIDFQSFEAQVNDSLLRERLMATLAGFFGILAAILATVGLYGVMSYMVARRRSEIGIRLALGADRINVLSMVMREAGGLLAIGMAIGVVIAAIAARAASSLLYGLQPHDPMTILLALAALAAVALPASFLPARRASLIEPMAALREE